MSMNIPKHIAIIMDGNRRWARAHHQISSQGHLQGTRALHDTIQTCLDLGISYLTVFAFSTENWQRSEQEINFLLQLFIDTIVSELSFLCEYKVQVRFLGERLTLRNDLQYTMNHTEEQTLCDIPSLYLQIAFNYGGQQEIIHAIQQIPPNESANINLKDFEQYINPYQIPDVDLLIRTGGEKRISNFLLWQLAYAELLFIDIYWPDFTAQTLISCIKEYHSRQRRFGA